jgi:hypothetical protein
LTEPQNKVSEGEIKMAPADEEQAIGREKTCFSYLDATPKFDLGPFCTKNTNFVSVFVERDDVTARKN